MGKFIFKKNEYIYIYTYIYIWSFLMAHVVARWDILGGISGNQRRAKYKGNMVKSQSILEI